MLLFVLLTIKGIPRLINSNFETMWTFLLNSEALHINLRCFASLGFPWAWGVMKATMAKYE
jgi:hypothetical protein